MVHLINAMQSSFDTSLKQSKTPSEAANAIYQFFQICISFDLSEEELDGMVDYANDILAEENGLDFASDSLEEFNSLLIADMA